MTVEDIEYQEIFNYLKSHNINIGFGPNGTFYESPKFMGETWYCIHIKTKAMLNLPAWLNKITLIGFISSKYNLTRY